MLISIHIPKTAGTSFGLLLKDRFGDRLLEDYQDRPLASAALSRLTRAVSAWPGLTTRLHGFEAVHGHFLAVKYLPVRAPMVTWLRHPAQRVLSRYGHYLRDVEAGRSLPASTGLRPGLSLDEFSALPRFRDTCSKYLRGLPRQRIAVYGFSDDVPASLLRMRDVLDLELGIPPQANRNPATNGSDYALEPAQERRLLQLNQGDWRLWCWAREREGV